MTLEKENTNTILHIRYADAKFKTDPGRVSESGLPEIRFVWTSLTYLFDEELEETEGSKKRTAHIHLGSLDEDEAFGVLKFVPSLQRESEGFL